MAFKVAYYSLRYFIARDLFLKSSFPRTNGQIIKTILQTEVLRKTGIPKPSGIFLIWAFENFNFLKFSTPHNVPYKITHKVNRIIYLTAEFTALNILFTADLKTDVPSQLYWWRIIRILHVFLDDIRQIVHLLPQNKLEGERNK